MLFKSIEKDVEDMVGRFMAPVKESMDAMCDHLETIIILLNELNERAMELDSGLNTIKGRGKR